jgi:hypothetical protein
MTHQPLSLESALERVRLAYIQLRQDSPVEAERETLDDLLERLADLAEEDGSIVLEDGSRLFVFPERGDRGGETGRIGVVQRFSDERPEQIHLVTA